MENKAEKIIIPISDGYRLVAERNTNTDYDKELIISVEDENGAWCQDVAIIRPKYHIGDNGKTVWDSDTLQALIFADCNQEDYTDAFTIARYKESE